MDILNLKNLNVSYKIRRSRKVGRITIKVNANGVELVLPLGVSVAAGERFLNSKMKWVEEKLTALNKDANRFYFLGKEVFPVRKNNCLLFDEFPADENYDINLVKPEFENFLFTNALHYIPERVAQLAFQYNFNFGKVKVKKLKSRWGSCSSKKNLSFNYKLMEYPVAVIDYVIIHELCHTRIMNHSKEFWATVRSIIPDYKHLKKKLNKRDKNEG